MAVSSGGAATRWPLPALLLAVGCGGGGPSWSTSFGIGPASAETKLTVSAWKGKVRLRNGGPGVLGVTVRGKPPVPHERLVTFSADGKTPVGAPGIRIDEAAKDSDLEIEIAAPPGISLVCSCAEADVSVSGSWGHLQVATGGAIDVRVDAAESGSLKSRRGAIAYAAATGPSGELRAESTSGDVSVTLPAQWNGQLKFQTQSGRLDVPQHESLRTIWDEDRKGVVGHLGPPREKGAPLAVVWGTSATGSVSFRVGE
jgi:hypothetical protein